MWVIYGGIMKEIKISSKGFTLLELLVVVLIIGILASIALPQYQMAVTKAKVASILPIMRRWKDALQEYKLQHGSYCKEGEDGNCGEYPDGSDLGVSWPSDWKDYNDDPCGDYRECHNDYWYSCGSNSFYDTGEVFCEGTTGDDSFDIMMYQPDDPNFENLRNKITCYANGDEAHKICKALGGKLAEEDGDEYILY